MNAIKGELCNGSQGNVVGSKVVRVDGYEKVTGKAIYWLRFFEFFVVTFCSSPVIMALFTIDAFVFSFQFKASQAMIKG